MTGTRRRLLRLPGYDYSQPGAYFITLRARPGVVLGNFSEGGMSLNSLGEVVAECWADLPNHYPTVLLDALAIMPDHLHGVIFLLDLEEGGAGLKPAPTEAAGTGFVSPVGAGFKPAPVPLALADTMPEDYPHQHNLTPGRVALSEVIRAIKTFSARRINELRHTPGKSLWQRGYYEHVIRNEGDLNRIREYILDNPAAAVLHGGLT